MAASRTYLLTSTLSEFDSSEFEGLVFIPSCLSDCEFGQGHKTRESAWTHLFSPFHHHLSLLIALSYASPLSLLLFLHYPFLLPSTTTLSSTIIANMNYPFFSQSAYNHPIPPRAYSPESVSSSFQKFYVTQRVIHLAFSWTMWHAISQLGTDSKCVLSPL